MMVTLIHSVRTAAYGKLEPVGVWEVTDDGHRCHYAEGMEQYEQRGWAALLDQPNVPPVEWALYRADRSPTWRIHKPGVSLGEDAEGLPEILGYVRAQFFAHIAEAAEASRRPSEILTSTSQGKASAFASAQGARINALSWWVAGALARRHPELIAYESHPVGGMYDMLTVAHPRELSPDATGAGPRVAMNRGGSIHLPDADGHQASISWDQVEHDRAATIALLESVLGYPPTSPASASPRSLAYRFLAAALDLFVTDRHEWDVRCEFLDTTDWPADDPGHIRSFPSARADAERIRSLGIHGEPLSHFFTLLRDDEPIVMVSIDGQLHRKSGAPVDLMLAYEKHGRRIRWMTASLLRDWL